MDIKFDCTNANCRQRIVVDITLAGRLLQCPSCGASLQAPSPTPKTNAVETAASPVFPQPMISAYDKKEAKAFSVSAAFKRLALGWGIGVVMFGFLIGTIYSRACIALPSHVNEMLNELYYQGEFRDAPTLNHAGTVMLYARDAEIGVGIFLLNLETLERKEINRVIQADKSQMRAFKLFGWSPDDNYLAYSVEQTNGKGCQVIVCDGRAGNKKASFEVADTVEQGVWVTDKSLVLLSHSHKLSLLNIETESHLGEFAHYGLIDVKQLDNEGPYWLTVDSGHAATYSVAYVQKGNLWSLDILSGRVSQLTSMTNASLAWPDYCPDTDSYLFCNGNSAKYDDTRLYKYCPGSRNASKITKLTDSRSSKGQWLQAGTGIAYVANNGKDTYLVVDTKKNDGHTNLFFGKLSYVRSFSVAPKRDKVYAIASTGYEPLSIWEYDIADRSLRNLISSKEGRVFTQTVVPSEASVAGVHGERIEYELFQPAQLKANKKYPVIIEQYSDGHYYQQNIQLLVNMGIFYVYPGIAGSHIPTTSENTLIVYNELLKNPNVDPHRIYISGTSAGTVTASKLFAEHSKLWRGGIFLSPVVLPTIPQNITTIPNVFICIGDQEDLVHIAQCEHLVDEAGRHLARAQIVYQPAGHWISSTELFETRYKAVATFILTDF